MIILLIQAFFGQMAQNRNEGYSYFSFYFSNIFIINILDFLILILIFLCINHIKITKVRSLKRVLLISLILINIFDWISFRISFNAIKLNSINNFDFLLFVLRFYIILYICIFSFWHTMMYCCLLHSIK